MDNLRRTVFPISKVAIIKTKSPLNHCFFFLLLLSFSLLFLFLLSFSFVAMFLALLGLKKMLFNAFSLK